MMWRGREGRRVGGEEDGKGGDEEKSEHGGDEDPVREEAAKAAIDAA